jgi:HAMP domain-containing protein
MRALLATLPFKSRLGLTSFLLLLAAIAAICVLAVAGYQQELRVGLLANASVRAELAAQEAAEALEHRDPRAAYERLALLRLDPQVLSARLYDLHGDILTEYRSIELRDAPPIPEAAPQAGHRFLPLYVETSRPVMRGDAKVGTIVLLTALRELRYDVVAFGVKLALIATVALLLASVAMARLHGAILSPVSELSELMRRVLIEKRYDLRATLRASDEIGALAAGFNAMLERLGDRDATLHRELADRSQAQRRLEELAHFDPLTKLPNRQFFSRQLERALVESARTGRSTRPSAMTPVTACCCSSPSASPLACARATCCAG